MFRTITFVVFIAVTNKLLFLRPRRGIRRWKGSRMLFVSICTHLKSERYIVLDSFRTNSSHGQARGGSVKLALHEANNYVHPFRFTFWMSHYSNHFFRRLH